MLEWLDHAGPILKEPVRIEQGNAIIPDRPGAGIEWNEAVIQRFIVE
jgi:mandelate racemase